MSDIDRDKKPRKGSGQPPPRFGVRQDRPAPTPPRPIDRRSDLLDEISIGTRSVSRPTTVVKERTQQRIPRIAAQPVADEAPELHHTPSARSAEYVRQADRFVELPAYHQPSGGQQQRATLFGFELSGPLLAAIVSAACLLILYTLWSQPTKTRFSDYANRQGPATNLPQVNPADYPQLSTPPGESSVIGPPTISAADVDRILSEYGSPAAGTGEAWVSLGMQYKIDPAYAVAFFIHESSAGTNPAWAGIKPDGSTTHNVGNIICAGYPTCFNRFRDYPNWETGIDDWYKLIAVEYIEGRSAHTIEQIIPIYAPSFENNVPQYVGSVNDLVRGWRAARGSQ